MTAPDRRLAGSLLSRARWAGAVIAALALAALVAAGSPGAARAAGSGDSYNQMTGAGTTASAVTVAWTQGLLNAQNQPITTPGNELSPNSDRSGANQSPLSFMYTDFKNLKITVSQTQNIGHQGVTVTWTGGVESTVLSGVQSNFLQMMECYGDSNTGPSPENCQYGSSGMLPAGVANPGMGQRTGDVCGPGSVPSKDHPPLSADGSSAQHGCDTHEPTDSHHVAPCPGTDCAPNTYAVPFVPVNDPTTDVYPNELTQYFNEFNTNEVQAALTRHDGTGQQQFETLTNTQASGLGCGQVESNGQPRGCWLVIVPRGQYEPNGYQLQGAIGLGASIGTSPLSASNWAQRIQIHLGYAPLQAYCPIGTQERETVGTQVITRAVTSWQLALNNAAKCAKIYGYTAVPESSSTSQLTTPGGGTGLAFTTIPIGSEATRYPGGHAPKLPNILYAPVAVTALDFGFNINDGGGYVTTPIKLTQKLLAKALTQVYRTDLPDYYLPPTHPGPAWSQHNPANMSNDSAFQKLNPASSGALPYNLASIPLAPLLTVDRSALNQQVWQWVQSDPVTRAWLDGTTDKSDPVVANPDFTALKLGQAPALDSYPRAYKGVLDLGKSGTTPPKEEIKRSGDLLPYTDSFDTGAAAVLAANDPSAGEWSDQVKASDNSDGWWQKTGVQPLGQIFMSTASDTPDLAAYGLISAQLCDAAGSSCVQPTIGNVTQALNSATADSNGLLHVNPAKVGQGGYPLVDVVYAAVPTNQSAAALNDYASMIAYAAGQGQTTGSAPGDLPPGYLPLPAKLKSQADAVVAKLRANAGPTPAGSPTSSGGLAGPGALSPSSGAPGGTSGTTPGSSGSQGGPAAGSAGGVPTSPGGTVSPPSGQLLSGTTPRQPMGGIRWVLIAVIITGAVGVLGGTLLRTGRIPRWLRRARA